jgi:hypothetical protein
MECSRKFRISTETVETMLSPLAMLLFRNFLFFLTLILWNANTAAVSSKYVPFTGISRSKPFGLSTENTNYTNIAHHEVHDVKKTNYSSCPYVSVSVLLVGDDYEPDSQPFILPGSLVVWQNRNQTQQHVWYHKTWFRKNNIALWHSAALMSDVVIILLPKDHCGENMSDLVWSLKLGWKHRILSGLSRGRLLLLLPSTESNIISPAVEVWLEELKAAGLSSVVERIDVKNSQQSNQEVLSIRCHSNGSHTLTDLSSFIHVFQETFLRLGGSLLMEPASIRPRNIDCFADSAFSSKSIEVADTNRVEVTDPNAARSTSSYDDDDDSTNMYEELESMQIMIDDIKNQQEEYSLNTSNSDVLSMDFVTLLDPLISKLIETGPQLQPQTLCIILLELQSIYCQYLDLLRDHFGTVYELVLDNRNAALDDPEMSNVKQVQDRIINTFRQAAEHALIPLQPLLPLLQKCNVSIDYFSALSKMESDLCDATDLRIELLVDGNDVVADSSQQTRRKRFLQFCKTLALRTLMLGINYAQGWIALQSIKRMALEREREMPKFPLF